MRNWQDYSIDFESLPFFAGLKIGLKWLKLCFNYRAVCLNHTLIINSFISVKRFGKVSHPPTIALIR